MNRLTAWIKREEGCEPRAYRDPSGFWTVGYGHNLEVSPLSPAAMDQILADDLAEAAATVDRLGRWTANLTEARYAVLVHLAFWVGGGGIRKFVKLLAACETADYAEAAQEIEASELPKMRARRLARQMREGTWPTEKGAPV